MTDGQLSIVPAKAIGKLVDGLKERKKRIEELEEEIKGLKGEVKEFEEVLIPDAMTELIGGTQITLLSGEIVKVDPFYYARLPKEPEPFFKWLRANNFGGLIKEKIEVMPDSDLIELITDFLIQFNVAFEQMSTVHWKTLEAWFKECIEAGVKNLPTDLFTSYVGRKAKVK
jgi:hypothetical protein